MENPKANRALNTSGDSLYEDAVSQSINNMTNVNIKHLRIKFYIEKTEQTIFI